MGRLLSTETQCLPKALISPHSAPKPKPKFGRPLREGKKGWQGRDKKEWAGHDPQQQFHKWQNQHTGRDDMESCCGQTVTVQFWSSVSATPSTQLQQTITRLFSYRIYASANNIDEPTSCLIYKRKHSKSADILQGECRLDLTQFNRNFLVPDYNYDKIFVKIGSVFEIWAILWKKCLIPQY